MPSIVTKLFRDDAPKLPSVFPFPFMDVVLLNPLPHRWPGHAQLPRTGGLVPVSLDEADEQFFSLREFNPRETPCVYVLALIGHSLALLESNGSLKVLR